MSIDTDNENLLRAVPNMLPYTLPPLVVDGAFDDIYLSQILGIYPVESYIAQAEENFTSIADNNFTSSADNNLNTVADNSFSTVSRRG